MYNKVKTVKNINKKLGGIFLNRLNIINYISNIANQNNDNEELIKAIEEAKLQLECARTNFNYAEDFNLIEAAIFTEEAAKRRYDYYISIAKNRGISVSSEYIMEHCTEIFK